MPNPDSWFFEFVHNKMNKQQFSSERKGFLVIAHSQREKQRLLAMLFSTSKCEKSKAKLKLAEAKVDT